MKLISKEKMKEEYFCFLKLVDINNFLEEFIDKEIVNINSWYLKAKKDDDVVISASPDFLVERFMMRLGVRNVIASNVDEKTGVFNSGNCRGKEKVLRFRERYPDSQIDRFYSDSKSDLPLAQIAVSPYFVKKNKPEKWIIE